MNWMLWVGFGALFGAPYIVMAFIVRRLIRTEGKLNASVAAQEHLNRELCDKGYVEKRDTFGHEGVLYDHVTLRKRTDNDRLDQVIDALKHHGLCYESWSLCYESWSLKVITPIGNNVSKSIAAIQKHLGVELVEVPKQPETIVAKPIRKPNRKAKK